MAWGKWGEVSPTLINTGDEKEKINGKIKCAILEKKWTMSVREERKREKERESERK